MSQRQHTRESAPELDSIGLRVDADTFGLGTPSLDRHPGDGWTMAAPFPMGASTRQAFRALIRLLCPPDIDVPGLEDRIEEHVRRMMAYMPRPAAWGLRFAFDLLDWMPRLLLRSTRRLRGMDPARARALLERLSTTRFAPLQTLMYAVKGLILSAFFDQDEAHRAIGYAPLPFLRERIALRERLLAGAGPHTGDYIATYPGVDP
jgi:hypothetical protein